MVKLLALPEQAEEVVAFVALLLEPDLKLVETLQQALLHQQKVSLVLALVFGIAD